MPARARVQIRPATVQSGWDSPAQRPKKGLGMVAEGDSWKEAQLALMRSLRKGALCIGLQDGRDTRGAWSTGDARFYS